MAKHPRYNRSVIPVTMSFMIRRHHRLSNLLPELQNQEPLGPEKTFFIGIITESLLCDSQSFLIQNF